MALSMYRPPTTTQITITIFCTPRDSGGFVFEKRNFPREAVLAT